MKDRLRLWVSANRGDRAGGREALKQTASIAAKPVIFVAAGCGLYPAYYELPCAAWLEETFRMKRAYLAKALSHKENGETPVSSARTCVKLYDAW